MTRPQALKKTRGKFMKTTKWRSKVAIALLLAVMMLFGVLAVTVIASGGNNDGGITYSEEWYSVKYIPATDTENAKLDIRLSPEFADYTGIDKSVLSELKDRLFEVAYQLVYDSVMKEVSEETVDTLSVSLLSSVGNEGGIVIPDNIDLDSIDIRRLEKFITDHFTEGEAKEKIQDFIDGKYDTVIAIAVDKYSENHDYEEIAAKAEAIFKDVVDIVYGDDSQATPEVIEIKENLKAETKNQVIEIVEEVKATAEAGEQITVEISDIVYSLNSAKIDGISVYETVEGDSRVVLEGIKELIKGLPTFAEIAEFDDTEMLLAYTVEAEFIFGEVKFDLSVGFEGDCELIRTAAGLIADYVSFETLSDGTYSVTLNVPDKVSSLLVKALESDAVSDELKHKVFTLMSSSVADANEYLQELTFDEVIELLQGIDFESILEKEAISSRIDLTDLTNEEIINKARSLEGYYGKALGLVQKVFNKLPENIKGKSLLDVYRGEGVFSVSVNKEGVDIENLLTSVSEKYGTLIASFMDSKTIDIKAKLTVNFASVNRVTFKVGDSVTVGDGFLPEGADVGYFANLAEYGGKPVLAWVDASGTEYGKMPDEDIVLYAYFGGSLTLEKSDDIETVYNGSDIPLSVQANYQPYGVNSDYTVTYAWYKGEVAPENLISGQNSNTLNVKTVADSGSYICAVTVDEDGRISTASATFSVVITKKSISVSGATWNYDPTNPFFYDGTEKSVVLSGLPAGVIAQYADNAFIGAGSYTASVTLTPADADNTVLSGVVNNEFQWEIKKATYDMSGVTFADKTVNYDGNAHSIEIQGALPDGVTVQYTEAKTAVGTYVITATFFGDSENYNEISPLCATLVILPRNVAGVNFSYIYDGEVIVSIVAKNPLGEDVVLTVVDKSGDYKNFDFSSVANEGEVTFGGAYDISFSKGGEGYSVKDNTFTVRLLIPEAIRNKENLIVIHIADDGAVTTMDAERDGNYMVFETTHFSVYAVICTDTEQTDLWWIWVIIAILALLVVVLAVLLIIKSKKGGEPEEPNEETPDDKPEPDTDGTSTEEEPAAEETTEEEPVTEETPVEEPVAEETPKEEPVAEPVKDDTIPLIIGDDDSIVVDGTVVYIRYRSSFTSRLIQSEAPIQDYYTAIKNYLLSFKGVKARTSFNYEAFNKGRTQCVRVNVKGKAILLNLALNPADYNVNKYHFTDMSSDTKVAAVPMLLKVKSERSLKYAFELIDEVMRALGIEQGVVPDADYHMPYEPNSQLAKRGLVKVILPAGIKLDKNLVLKEADVNELFGGISAAEKSEDAVNGEPLAEEAEENTVTEETPEAEPAEAGPAEEEPSKEEPKKAYQVPQINADDSVMINGEAISIRYRSSFTSRLIQAEASVQDYYTVIKNYLLSFKGVKARTSWNYENFNKGRTQCARINVKGKTLTLNLALAPEGYNINKYHFTDMSDDPKFDKLPMLLKVRSGRALKYAIELINELMNSLGISQSGIPEEDYHLPYEPNSELAKRGLVKIILPKGVKLEDAATLVESDVGKVIAGKEEMIEPAIEEVAEIAVAEEIPMEEIPTEEVMDIELPHEIHIINHHIAEEEIVHVNAVTADKIVSDSVAEEFIECIKHEGRKPASSKCYEINLDVICDNYEDGETVTVENLKEKKLLPEKAERVKVLARGVMTKRLTVCADKFSIQAVKMIGLAGGVVDKFVD